MKIIQLTDLHIPGPDDDAHGVDVRQNFLHLLDAIKEVKPDQLIITGDLCHTAPVRSTYTWIGEQLDKLEIPVSFLSGNHDDPTMLAEELGVESYLNDGELYGTLDWNGADVLFLDTSPGKMSTEQKAWLRRTLSESNRPNLIFMHHPPVLAGVPFMDQKHPFKEREELAEIFEQTARHSFVFCGHYHVECHIQLPNLSVYITPSAYFQIDRNYRDFHVDHRRIAYRWIEWEPDSVLRTGVKYFDGHDL
ncbi:MAG: metallophosphoesterase [Bacteroidetes bacterium]|nr:metallophosphoesterase [Bacteroidota bacterium]